MINKTSIFFIIAVTGLIWTATAHAERGHANGHAATTKIQAHQWFDPIYLTRGHQPRGHRQIVNQHRFDFGFDRRYSKNHYRRDRRQHHRHQRQNHLGRDLVRLDLPVHIRGRRTVKLRRLISSYYDIDLKHYALREVVVNNHRRHGRASLAVGYADTTPVHLHRGRNYIAPQSHHSDGRWSLSLRGVRTDNIRVVLQPKYSGANKQHNRRRHGHRS